MTAEELDATLAALADPTRRAVIDLLRERPVSAGAIAKTFDTSLPAMSRHLRVLRKSGLVEDRYDEDDARIRLYQLRAEKFIHLKAWISELEKFWSVQLLSLKAYSEGLCAENTE